MRFGKVAMVAGVGVVGAALAIAQEGGPGAASGDKPTAEQAAKAAPGGGFPDLIRGLKETPGCLGVETAQTTSRKNVIFAWFQDKKSALAWYNSDMHKGLMQGMGAGEARGLRHVPDDGKPVMVIASITMAIKGKIEGFPIPISQISIELYQPLPGGASINGTFAPKEMEIPQMKYLDADAEPDKKAGETPPK